MIIGQTHHMVGLTAGSTADAIKIDEGGCVKGMRWIICLFC